MRQRLGTVRERLRERVGVELDARQQQLAEDGFAMKARGAEEGQRGGTQASRFEMAPGIAEALFATANTGATSRRCRRWMT